LAYASSMFTVHGTEGTTGNYVNEHGFVHQTITIRHLCNQSTSASHDLVNSISNNDLRSSYTNRRSRNNSGNTTTEQRTTTAHPYTRTLGSFTHLLRGDAIRRHRSSVATSSSSSDDDVEDYTNNDDDDDEILNRELEIVSYSGRPETRDSWFPGYSWLVMSCAFCGHHLGWKFQSVRNVSMASLDETASTSSSPTRSSTKRPRYFFGISSTNVTTFIPENKKKKKAKKKKTKSKKHSNEAIVNNKKRTRF
jgi:hypothetical protein